MSEPTYTINADRTAITCHRCGMTSYHPSDVQHLYCGMCKQFHQDALEPGALRRPLGTSHAIWLRPQLFNYLLCIGRVDDPAYDDMWEYLDFTTAMHAFAEWDGIAEPAGWYRHPPSGRRRPDGDASKEYIHL